MRSLFNFSSRGIAIDLGTANTVVYVSGQGIITSEPSVVAMEIENGVRKVSAVGDDAKLMMGKTPQNIRTIRPLRAGVIADLEVAEEMIKHFIRKAHGGPSRFSRGPEVVICIPSGATSVVPPPMSTTIDPIGSATGSPAPIAAAIGSSMSDTRSAPALVTASRIARRSTEVAPDGTQMTTSGPREKRLGPPCALRMNA